MNSAIEQMLEKYNCQTPDEYKNALKEIIQELALSGLNRCNFFGDAAFYGGSALRIFHELDRFSEDLDFSLLEPNDSFNISRCCDSILFELESYGFSVAADPVQKTIETPIESAFIKGSTKIHLIKIGAFEPPIAGISTSDIIKIKLEVDTNPPGYGETEILYLLNPIPFGVRVFTLPALFAGKIHAVLCRSWGSDRIKGRDLYDYIWYLSKGVTVDMMYLGHKLHQTGHLQSSTLDMEGLKEMLRNKFSIIDYAKAVDDVRPFIKDTKSLEIWSVDFFKSITNRIKAKV